MFFILHDSFFGFLDTFFYRIWIQIRNAQADVCKNHYATGLDLCKPSLDKQHFRQTIRKMCAQLPRLQYGQQRGMTRKDAKLAQFSG